MSLYDNFNQWDFVDGVGNYITMQTKGVTEQDVQNVVDKAFGSINASLNTDEQELSLSINNNVVSTVTIEDKYLQNVAFDEEAQALVFTVSETGEQLKIDLSKLLDEYSTDQEVDDKLEAKQDKLTAGEGVEISEDGVISTKVDLTDYVTKEEFGGLETLYQEISTEVSDLEGKVYTKEEADEKFLTEHQDISNLATKEEVSEVEEKIPSLEGYATEEWVESKNYLTEHQSLEDYATTEYVDGEVETLTSFVDEVKNDVYTKTEADEKFITEHQDISSLATKEELSNAVEGLATEAYVESKITEVEDDLNQTETELTAKIEGLSSDLEALDEEVVKYKTFNGDRKTVSLNNRDTISAVTPNGGSQIAMVSDYEGLDFPVVEIGGQSGALVLNTCEDRVKVEVVENGKRVQHSVATLDDVPSVEGLASETYVNNKIDQLVNGASDAMDTLAELEGAITSNKGIIDTLNSAITSKASKEELEEAVDDMATMTWVEEKNYLTEHQDLSDYETKEHAEETYQPKGDYPVYERYDNEEQNIHKKTITLENDDNISGKMVDGLSINLIEVSKWNVVDIGSKSAPAVNLNSAYERPLYNDKHGIALLDDIDALKTELIEKINTVDDRINKIVLQMVKSGGSVTLADDVNVSDGCLTLTQDVVLDLNSNELTAKGNKYGDSVEITSGNVTIKNGVIKESENTSMDEGSAVIMVKGDSNVTLEDVTVSGVYPLYVNDPKSSVTIKSGNFTSRDNTEDVPYDKGVAVYVQKGGFVVIEGGQFGEPLQHSTYLLNLKDDLVKDGTDPRNFILVKGGQFYNFNPSQSMGEPNGPVSFVADGYKVMSENVGEDTIYTVLAKTNDELTTEFTGALKNGGDIKLEADTTFPERIVMQKKGTIDLGGNTLTSNENGKDSMVITGASEDVEVTIKNGTFVSNNTDAAYGVIAVQKNPKVILEDVKVEGINPIMMYSTGNGTITVNSGEFTSTGSQCVYYYKGAGKITINGGVFKSEPYNGKYYTLNVLDSTSGDKDPREFIEVYGGKFYNFNPMDAKTEKIDPTNFVAEGYHVEQEKDGDDVVYKVIKDDEMADN